VPAVWNHYAERIQAKIRNREFDLLLLDNWMKLPTLADQPEVEALALLSANYELLDTLSLQLLDRPGGGYYRVQIWRPKNSPVDT
jgi:hypothetical protein